MMQPSHDRRSSGPPPNRRPVTTCSRIAAGALLIAPLAAMLWVSSYARTSPVLWNTPFFYWYQLLWVPVTFVALFGAYLLLRLDRQRRRTRRIRERR
jgi:membrane protein implicated in regulation of membrane protease activity